MKKILAAVTSILITNLALAIPYPDNNPKDMLIKQETSTGSKFSIDVAYLDKMLKDLSIHAKNYPVQFDSESDKDKAIRDVKALDYTLSIINESPKSNPSMLLRQAQLNSIGHNLDVAGSAEKADKLFQSIIDITPENSLANYYYGVFLAGSGQASKAIPLLHKAAAANLYDAYFSLGMAYLSMNNTPAALENLEKYKSFSENTSNIDKIIDAIKSGSFKVNRN